MIGKVIFGTGLAVGYVLGTRSGRANYDALKAKAAELWASKPVQDNVSAATEAVKEKAPEVSEQLAEAARRAGTVISSAVHREAPEDTRGAAAAGSDVQSDPALTDEQGSDWSDEGGATQSGPATNTGPARNT